LRLLIRSLTPSENQPSASASTLRCLYIYRCDLLGPISEAEEGLVRDLVAFQRSNGKLGGGLEAFQHLCDFPSRGYPGIFSLVALPFLASIENAFALAAPEAADSPARGLRRLKVTHPLRGLPACFRRVGKMRALEHLKIVIAGGDSNSDISEAVEAEDEQEDVQHSVSSLGIEGEWRDLFPAINLCTPPSPDAQFQSFRLYYYLPGLPRTQKAIAVFSISLHVSSSLIIWRP